MRYVMLVLGLGTALVAVGCTDPPDAPLTAAAARNDATDIRRLLAAGTAPDAAGRGGITPLTWAARAGAIDAMTALLDAGADPNAIDTRSTRWPTLLHAIHKQHPDAVRLLLTRGANPNLAAPGGLTPLIMAADDPDPTTVTLLLSHGANPRAEGPGGTTPLTQAVSGGALTDITDRPLLGGCHPATVRALLAHDPSLAIPETQAGRQALWWARFNKCDDVLSLVGRQQAASIDQSQRPPSSKRSPSTQR
jgi:ankyrin repeat protein